MLLVWSVFTLPAEAQIYKWVDASGKTRYGDTPPASGNAETQVMKTAPTGQSGAQAPDWEEKDRDFRRRRIERDAMKPGEAATPASRQICASARHKMQTLDGRRVYRLDKNGERVYMEDGERAAIEAKAQQDIATYCPR